jgi:hypothetical protein
VLERQRYIHILDQVYKINAKKVWNERLQTSQYSYVGKLQVK